jgi:1-phosphofructokinase
MTTEPPPVVITVTPNPGLDLTYTLPAKGSRGVEVHRASSSTLEASGKGVNVSRALQTVAVPTCAVLPVGGPTGRYLVELLDDEQVPHRVVPQEGHTRVNTTVLRPQDETFKVNGPGAPLTTAEQDALLVATRLALEDALAPRGQTWVAVCGSLPPGVSPHLVTDLVELAHAYGARCAVDVSGDALSAALHARADLVAPNRGELADVVDGTLGAAGVQDLAHVALSLSRETGSHLLVSLGPEGALYADAHRLLHGTATPLTPVNSAGAGDALLAGWLSTTADPRSRLATAVAWGRSACLSPTTVDNRHGLRDSEPIVVTVLDDRGREATEGSL